MRNLIAGAILGALPLSALAAPPPADALPLSEIIAMIEAEHGDRLAYIDEVEWDDDGYWEIELKDTDGQDVKLRVDPLTGAATPRD